MSQAKLKIVNQHQHPIDRLIEVMAQLRNPDGGCPWDLEQNFKTIAPYTIEEAYEVAEAIDNDDMTNLREELGDLLLQPIYHAQMASEADQFNIHDVIHDITEKMIHRHPHVFGDQNAANSEDVNAIWDQRKDQEHNEKHTNSALEGVPKTLPAALRAQKLQKKAAKTGFEWTKTEDVLDKLVEEIKELQEARTKEEKLEEFGDILFVMVNYGRILGLNAEEALRQCNTKFERRFKGMEDDFKKKNKHLNEISLEEMLQCWKEQKLKE